MIHTVRFLQPIRASLTAITSSSSQLSHSKLPLNGTIIQPLKTWMKNLNPEARDFLRNSQWKFIRKYHQPLQNLSKSGAKVSIGKMVGLSFVSGSIGRSSMAYSDGIGFTEDEYPIRLSRSSESEAEKRAIVTFLTKLLIPIFIFCTVIVNWGHPMIIGAKVALTLLSTKPSPLSVYLFVDQLRDQEMSKRPFYYKLKTLYAKKVDVADYTFLCVAKLELSDQKLTLIGIMGSWWVLPVSSLALGWSQIRDAVHVHFT